MAIAIQYGDIGPLLGAGYKAGLYEQMNKNNALRSEAESRALQAQAAMSNALNHGQAINQGSIDNAMQVEAQNSRDTADNQTRANLLGTQEQNQLLRDYRENQFQTTRDVNLNQMRVKADEQNDARTAEREQQNRMIQMGVPLTWQEDARYKSLQGEMATIDQRQDLQPAEREQYRNQIRPELSYLQGRSQAATQRQDQENQRQAFRTRVANTVVWDRTTGAAVE